MVLIGSFYAPSIYAAAGCPETADNLQGFTGCVAASRGGSMNAQLDNDHKALLSAMERNSGVPPQVMPAGDIQNISPYYYPRYVGAYFYYRPTPYLYNYISVGF